MDRSKGEESGAEPRRSGGAGLSNSEYAKAEPEIIGRLGDLWPVLLALGESAEDSTGEAQAAALGESATEETGLSHLRVGGYRIVRKVGRGGMGVVFEAEQESLQRRVALKLLPVHSLFDGKKLERFRREARAAAKLHHPNIVPVYEVGEERGIHYYAMQFIEGEGLDAFIAGLSRLEGGESHPSRGDASQDTRLSSSTGNAFYRHVARLILEATEAIAYAHGEGIVHRDLKPSNLILDREGKIWVTDFGLAKTEGSEDLTQTGDLLGTYGYMAPERFKGRTDARSDVYGLGATLYELLALQPTFVASDRAQLIEKVLRDDPVPLRRRDVRIPRDLETITFKAMEKDPGRRYQSARLFADDLRRYLSDQPIAARTAGATERTWRWCRRNPAVAALIISISLLLGFIAAGASLSVIKLRASLRESYLEQAKACRVAGGLGARFQGLEVIARAAAIEPGADLRNEAIACLTLPDMRVVAAWEENLAGIRGYCFDRDHERYAHTDPLGSIAVRTLPGDQEIRLSAGLEKPASFLAFSPRGRFLGATYAADPESAGGLLQVWDLDARAAVLSRNLREGGEAWSFHPDDRRLVYHDGNGVLRFWDLSQSREDGTLSLDRVPSSFRFDAPAHQVAVLGLKEPSALSIVTVATGATLVLKHPAQVYAYAWDPVRSRVATGCKDRHLRLWDAGTGEEMLSFRAHEAEVTRVTFNRTGSLLATSGWDRRTYLWEPWTGTRYVEASGHLASGPYPVGRLVGFHAHGEMEVGLWELTEGVGCRILGGHRGYKGPWALDFSPDGRLLASAGSDGIRVWDLSTSAQTAFLDVGTNACVLFHPTRGSLLAYAPEGLIEWQLAPTPDAPGSLLGPPRQVLSWTAGAHYHLAGSLDGKTLIIADALKRRLLALDLGHDPPVERVLGCLPDLTRVSLSPDGRWAAANNATKPESRVRIWDLRKGALATDLPMARTHGFSPDGRWFATCAQGSCRLWSTGTWAEERVLAAKGVADYGLAFTRDASLLALPQLTGDIALFAPASGREVARLKSPIPMTTAALAFSPCGGLLAAATEQHVIIVWDLARIRKELAAMDLDLELPPLPVGRALAPAAGR